MVKLSRRTFLGGLSSGLIGLGLFRLLPAALDLWHPNPAVSLANSLAGIVGHKKSALIVGREYVSQAPQEADPQRLVQLICLSCEREILSVAAASKDKLYELVEKRMRQDFECGRIVKVQGWILSEIEARLCALTALV